MTNSVTTNVSTQNVSTKTAEDSKTSSTSQGRNVSKMSNEICSDWVKKALLIAAIVISVFALAFTLAVVAGISGATAFGVGALAKTMVATFTFNGTLALSALTIVGAIGSIVLSALKLYHIDQEKADLKTKPSEEEIKKMEAEFRKKMSIDDPTAPFRTLFFEKKPLNPIAIQAFFESILLERMPADLAAIKVATGLTEVQRNQFLNPFSKDSSNTSERAAWAVFKLWSTPFGTPPSKEQFEALEVLKKAAEDDALSNFILAQCYSVGACVPKDTALLKKYMKIAADKGLAIAEVELSFILKDQINDQFNKEISPEIVRLVKSAADKNLPKGQVALSQLYRYGVHCEKNDELSEKYLDLALKQDCSDAKFVMTFKNAGARLGIGN